MVATALPLLHRLGESGICIRAEAVEATVVQRMVEHGELLFPLQNPRHTVYKPPLFHWTSLAIHKLAGATTVTAPNLRLTSVVYALAGITLTMAVAGMLLGVEAAILSGLTLGASFQYVSQGRYGRVDMALAFWEWLALAAFLCWMIPRVTGGDAQAVRSRAWALVLLAIALGFAVLTKGPVGALLPGAAIVVALVVEQRFADIRAMLRPGPVLLCALLASSFYALSWLGQRSDILTDQIANENLGRFFGTLGRMKSWYYVTPILLNSAPISLLIPVALVAALRRGSSERALATDRGARFAVRLLAIFWIVTVVFFSIAAYKRRAYLLPLWPPSAVMLAWWIGTLEHHSSGAIAKRTYIALCAVLILFNFVYLPIKERRECTGMTIQPIAGEIRDGSRVVTRKGEQRLRVLIHTAFVPL